MNFFKLGGALTAVLVLPLACELPDQSQTPERQMQLTLSSFESDDGNLIQQGGVDWENAPNLSVGIDLPTGKTDNSLGQGSKEDTEVPSVVDGSIPNNKSDLTRFYVANEGKDPQFLYLAWERANILGTANMSFEFNQSTVPSANGVTMTRTEGDILITFDWASGGHRVDLGLLVWVPADGDAGRCFASNSAPCWGDRVSLSDAGFADGAVNDGQTVYDPILGENLLEKTFGEAGINLTDSGVLDPNECRHFGRAFVKSRSSDSFTASLKDFIAPIPVNIDNCEPVTVQLLKTDPFGAPLAGAVMQLYLDDGDGYLDSGDTQVGSDCTTGLDGIGDCVFVLEQDGLYIGHEVTPPNGYLPAADKTVVVKLGVEPQTVTLTFTDQPAPGRIDVQKNDDLGAAVAGAVFELYADMPATGGQPGAEDVLVGVCTTDAAGQCSFLEVPPGEYWVLEIQVPEGYFPAAELYQHVTLGLGTAPGEGASVGVTFVNARSFMVIVVVCRGDHTLYPSTVSVDGLTDQSSVSPEQAAAAGFTEAELCSLEQACFDDLHAGGHSGAVSIP